MNKIKLDVEGMMCQGCVNRVTAKLTLIAGVKSVAADLAAKTVTVEGDNLDRKALIDAIISLGYDVALPA